MRKRTKESDKRVSQEARARSRRYHIAAAVAAAAVYDECCLCDGNAALLAARCESRAIIISRARAHRRRRRRRVARSAKLIALGCNCRLCVVAQEPPLVRLLLLLLLVLASSLVCVDLIATRERERADGIARRQFMICICAPAQIAINLGKRDEARQARVTRIPRIDLYKFASNSFIANC